MNKAIIHEHGSYRPVTCDRPKPDDNWPYHGHPTTPHDREFGVKNPKFERHIYIRRDQIFFDIDIQLSILADARKTPDGSQDDTITSATTKYQQMFYRWIDTHIGEAKTVMSAFVLEKFKDVAINSIKDKEEVDIELLVPEWYDDTTFPQLCDKVHEYVVAATIADFCYARFTSKDPFTVDKMEQKNECQSEIRKLANMAKPRNHQQTTQTVLGKMNQVMIDIWPYLMVPIAGAFGWLFRQVFTLKAKIDVLEKTVESLQATMQSTIDSIEKTIENIQKRQDSHSKKQDEFLEKMNSMEKKFIEQVGGVRTDIQGLSSDVKGLSNLILISDPGIKVQRQK